MTSKSLSMNGLIERVKAHPDISRAGMILCHNGIVRASDRSGAREVTALDVRVDRGAVEEVRAWALQQAGIVAVEIEALEGRFQVGDDLLYVVIAGDVRENVFAAMQGTIDRIKAHGVTKTEHGVQ